MRPLGEIRIRCAPTLLPLGLPPYGGQRSQSSPAGRTLVARDFSLWLIANSDLPPGGRTEPASPIDLREGLEAEDDIHSSPPTPAESPNPSPQHAAPPLVHNLHNDPVLEIATTPPAPCTCLLQPGAEKNS